MWRPCAYFSFFSDPINRPSASKRKMEFSGQGTFITGKLCFWLASQNQCGRIKCKEWSKGRQSWNMNCLTVCGRFQIMNRSAKQSPLQKRKEKFSHTNFMTVISTVVIDKPMSDSMVFTVNSGVQFPMFNTTSRFSGCLLWSTSVNSSMHLLLHSCIFLHIDSALMSSSLVSTQKKS